MKRVGIVGGGLAGVAAAYFLAQARDGGVEIEVTLFEATGRLGGIVETVREGWICGGVWAGWMGDGEAVGAGAGEGVGA